MVSGLIFDLLYKAVNLTKPSLPTLVRLPCVIYLNGWTWSSIENGYPTWSLSGSTKEVNHTEPFPFSKASLYNTFERMNLIIRQKRISDLISDRLYKGINCTEPSPFSKASLYDIFEQMNFTIRQNGYLAWFLTGFKGGQLYWTFPF